MKRRSSHTAWFHRSGAVVLALGVLLLVSACRTIDQVDGWVNGPFFSPTNFNAVQELPADVRRVAVLPIGWMDKLPEVTARSIEQALRSQLSRSERFEVVVIDSNFLQQHFGLRSLLSTDAVPLQLFDLLKRDFAADAVLFCDITELHAYPPLSIGVRARLVVARDELQTLWAFDSVFAAENPSVANSALRFGSEHRRDTAYKAPAGILNSPSHFAAFAFSQTFSTLPLRGAPKVPEKSVDTTK